MLFKCASGLRALRWLWLFVCASACSIQEEPKREDFGAPRQRDPVLAKAQALRARYVLTDQSRLTVSLKAREHTPKGVIAGATGHFELDLFDLTSATGSVVVDLTRLEMSSFEDAEKNAEQSRRAREWLGLGGERDPADRESVRRATFSLHRIDDASAKAAHEGRLEKKEKSSAADPALTETDETGALPETRTVRLNAIGALTLHGIRVPLSVALSAQFHYPAPAISGVPPDELVLETRRPFVVTLDAHGIVPRDARGVVIADELKLLGKRVGREARVEATLVAKRQPRAEPF